MSAQDTLTPGRTTLDSVQLAEMVNNIANSDSVLAETICSQVEDCDDRCPVYAESVLKDFFFNLSNK